MEDILAFNEVSKEDSNEIGLSGVNLSALTRLKISIPNGFIITNSARTRHLTEESVFRKINNILSGLRTDNPLDLEKKAKECQSEIKKIQIDQKLQSELNSFCKNYAFGARTPLIVSTSSISQNSVLSDSVESFGSKICTKDKLNETILELWSCSYSPRTILYNKKQNVDFPKLDFAIIVQQIKNVEITGRILSADVNFGKKSTMTVFAQYGLGALDANYKCTEDSYQINKKNQTILVSNIQKQKKQLIFAAGGSKEVFVARSYQSQQKIPNERLLELSKLCAKLETYYFFPQEIVWSFGQNRITIFKIRQMKVFQPPKIRTKSSSRHMRKILLIGTPVISQIATGKVKIIKNPNLIHKFPRNNILVAGSTTKIFMPAIKKAKAIITDSGSLTSHSALTARELGIACIVDTKNATKVLSDGQIVTVDGVNGIVWQGSSLVHSKNLQNPLDKSVKIRKTATKVFVNISNTDQATQYAVKNIDGAIVFNDAIVPKSYNYLNQKGSNDTRKYLINNISSKLNIVGRAFGQRDVYCFTQSTLPKLPPKFDYLKIQLGSLQLTRQKYSNVNLVIKDIRNETDFSKTCDEIKSLGFFRNYGFKLFVLVQSASTINFLSEFVKAGLNGIFISLDDLTMSILKADGNNKEGDVKSNLLEAEILDSFELAVKTAQRLNLSVSICLQTQSVGFELIKKIVSWGVGSISVNSNLVEAVRQDVYLAEKILLTQNKQSIYVN